MTGLEHISIYLDSRELFNRTKLKQIYNVK